MNPEIEKLIDFALADGVITDKERSVILRKAEKLGEDPDEVEMILDARLHESKKPKAKEKVGNIKICPACGESVKSFQLSCSECGHEFQSGSSIMKLQEKLDKISDPVKNGIFDFKYQDNLLTVANKKASIITNYKIPVTKENLLEWLTFGKQFYSKFSFTEVLKDPMGSYISFFNKVTIESQAKITIEKAYKRKIKEVLSKAKLSFKNDTEIKEFIKYYEK